jgi:predicted membrane protein
MDQIENLISSVTTLLNASDFSVILKIILILLTVTSGIWFKYLKKKMAEKAARKEEESTANKAEIDIRRENAQENQQASSDSQKVDDFLK